MFLFTEGIKILTTTKMVVCYFKAFSVSSWKRRQTETLHHSTTQQDFHASKAETLLT